jgi:hypothetical protein
MKRVAIAIIFVLGAPQVGLTVRADEIKGFGFGELVGQCLVAKCRIFRGSLLTEGPALGSTVKVRVDETLFGPPIDDETIDIPYADPKAFSKTYDPLRAAWELAGDIRFTGNTPVVVLQAMERIRGLRAGAPLLVISRQTNLPTIQLLAGVAKRLESMP